MAGIGRLRNLPRKCMMAPFNEIFLVQQWIFLRMEHYLYLLPFRELNATYLSLLPISPTLFSIMVFFFIIFITCILSKEFLVCRSLSRRIQYIFCRSLHADDAELFRAGRQKFQKCSSLINFFPNIVCTLLVKIPVARLQFTIEHKFTNTRGLLYQIKCVPARFTGPTGPHKNPNTNRPLPAPAAHDRAKLISKTRP
jgi:hypothetical protein